MKLDHVTYQVPAHALERREIGDFFELLGMNEIKPDGEIEKGWRVRWFEDKDNFQVHLVEADAAAGSTPVDLRLGHFCAVIDRADFITAVETKWCERNSGSGRAWLNGPCGIRVEIRPKELTMDNPHLNEADAIELGRQFLKQAKEVADPPSIHLHLNDGMGERTVVIDPKTFGFHDSWVSKDEIDSETELLSVLIRSWMIYRERNKQHKDSWKREGWRGCLYNLRRKVERAWDHLWDLDRDNLDSDYMAQHVDDLLDSINYAALTVLAVEEGNQGSWWTD